MAIEVGQRVKVRRLRDRIPANMVGKIKENPVGTVDGFRMVDGSGVGVIVKFDVGFATWFFEDELEAV
ncbi:cytochrome b6f subunit PetP [Microcoleus sp. herbarium12]|uniref:cytochrome b6f subunit PetP n=1 Tax=Microcoleus sp. herbarium12 TaxID=3055437 RepID=UPI002FD3F57D